MYNYVTLEFNCAKDENIRHSVIYDIKEVYLWLVSDWSWKVCPGHSNEFTYMSLNNRVYDSESVTMTIRYFNYIHFMQKTIACMSKHIHSLPW